ncbi:hypothetical protein BCV69DRAFT_311587 [Microstroma glucosiphilum]|uniref:Pal1-domain-containing protein n=1 Tax=Pseudomicrostroma glucosiphilum TaxID=1684307 RepID=A0A316U9P5_9BASI|nr:hypothetical protein BCV69DRAFT_311587 [Pseudomicrostroma glucosiphilum]PWN21879.1 hypothetical protein BCV69DRAFT_311587 [Pseudomicrostroma glucosiphilum]
MRVLPSHWLLWGPLAAVVSLASSGTHAFSISHDSSVGTATSHGTHPPYSIDRALQTRPHLFLDTTQLSALPLESRGLEEPTFYESKNEAKSRRGKETKDSGKGKAPIDREGKRAARLERKRKGYDADSEASGDTSVSSPVSPQLGQMARYYFGGSGTAPLSSPSKIVQHADGHKARKLHREEGYTADAESKYSDGDSPSSPISRKKKDKWMNDFAHAPHRPSKTLRLGSKLARPLSPSWREIGQPFG